MKIREMTIKESMKKAIQELILAKDRGDYAFGAALTDGKIVHTGGNRVMSKNDSTKHIELELIQYVVGTRKERYLKDWILLSTTEPCVMCLGAAYWAGIKVVYYGVAQQGLSQIRTATNRRRYRYRESPINGVELAEDLGIEMKQLMEQECFEAMLPRKKK